MSNRKPWDFLHFRSVREASLCQHVFLLQLQETVCGAWLRLKNTVFPTVTLGCLLKMNDGERFCCVGQRVTSQYGAEICVHELKQATKQNQCH